MEFTSNTSFRQNDAKFKFQVDAKMALCKNDNFKVMVATL